MTSAASFACRDSIRIASFVMAVINVGAILVCVAIAVVGSPGAVIVVPLFAWGAVETGRAAWVNAHRLEVRSDEVHVHGPTGTVSVPFDDIVWSGITRRGFVVDSISRRHDFFDQDWATTLEAHDAVLARVGRRARTSVTVHDDVMLARGRAVVSLTVGLLFAALVVIAMVADVDTGERVAVVVTAGPFALVAFAGSWSRARRPIELSYDEATARVTTLLGSDSVGGAPEIVDVMTPVQQLTGSDPATAISISGQRGPAAAPGSFDHLV